MGGATRIGRHQKRSGWIAGGTSAIALALLAAVTATRVNPNTLKPAAWLTWEVRHAGSLSVNGALSELQTRLRSGRLSDAQVDSLCATLLDRQANGRLFWPGLAGDVIEDAHAAGKLSDARWERYARQATVISLRVRPRVRPGDDLPFELVFSQNRAGSRTSLYASYADPAILVDDLPSTVRRGAVNIGAGGMTTVPRAVLAPKLAALGAGRHRLRVSLDLNIAASPAQENLSSTLGS